MGESKRILPENNDAQEERQPMIFTQEHEELRRTVRSFVEREINPNVDQWEKDGRFPIHEIFRKAGELGLLGISKPEKFGGMGLDYSYSIVAAEEFGSITCGGIPMAIGVQTDMCTPEMMTEVEALRALVYQATELYVKGRDVTRLASMAKLKAGRLGREVSDACLQYWGGMGFMWDNPVSRAYRDTRLVSIGGGADEIMLGIICKLMGILPGKKKG